MSDEAQFPLGAESADELLAALAAGRLDDTERAEVEAWVAAHPEWADRSAAWDAIGRAVRRDADASDVPRLADLGRLWAAIDDASAGPPSSPAPQAPVVPRPRRPMMRWALGAAAAAAVVAIAAAVVVTSGGGDDDSADTGRSPPGAQGSTVFAGAATTDRDFTTASATTDTPATSAPGTTPATGGVGPEVDRIVRAAAAATIDQGSARTKMSAIGRADLRGTPAEGSTGSERATITVTGESRLVFPDRSLVDTVTRFAGGTFDDAPTVAGRAVRVGDRTWVRCDDDEYVEDGQPCDMVGIGTTFLGIDELLAAAAEARDVEMIGSRFRFETTSRFAGSEVAVAVTVVVDDDGLLRDVRAAALIRLTITTSGVEAVVPVAVEVAHQLNQFGADVEIPTPE